MYVQRVHYTKVFIVLAATSGIILLMAKLKPGNEIVTDNGKNGEYPLSDVSKMHSMDDALSISALHSCPACLGRDLCPDFSQGFLTMSMFGSPSVLGLEYQGFLREEERLLVISPAVDTWRAWDAKICANSSQWSGCLVNVAARDSFLSRSLADAKTLRGLSSPPAPLTACADRRFAVAIQTAFDENKDEVVSVEERAMMMTSVAVAPAMAGLRMATHLGLAGVANYIGACGRLAVIQGNLTPLKEYLSSSWETRSSLAAQLLTMMENLISGDGSWVVLVWEVGWEDLAVTREGQLVLTHMDKVTLVNRDMIQAGGDEERPRCNQECFDQFKNRVFKQTPRGQAGPGCGESLEFADLMYLNICKNILSTGGLLHSPPQEHEQLLGQMIRECVEEDYPGSRWQVVEEIMDYLTGEDEEEEEDDQKKNEEDDMKDNEEYDQKDNEEDDLNDNEEDDLKDNEKDDLKDNEEDDMKDNEEDDLKDNEEDDQQDNNQKDNGEEDEDDASEEDDAGEDGEDDESSKEYVLFKKEDLDFSNNAMEDDSEEDNDFTKFKIL